VTASPNGGAINELTPTAALIDRAAARALPGLVLLALAPALAVPNAARAQPMPLAFSVTEPVRGTFDIDIEGTTSPGASDLTVSSGRVTRVRCRFTS